MRIYRKLSFIHWVIISFFALDIIFVILHFTIGQQVNYFNLDLEKNVPTLYQAFKLIVNGCVVFGIILCKYLEQGESHSRKFLLLPYWLGFVYLALDEVGEIHESFGGVINKIGGDAVTNYREFFVSLGFTSAQWLLFFIPIMVIAVTYLGYLARYFKKQKTGKIYLLILAIVCFGLVPVIEYWNTSGVSYSYSFNERNILIALEEYLEMLGATLFLAFNAVLLLTQVSKIKRLLVKVEKDQ